jgi:hypothetical protein
MGRWKTGALVRTFDGHKCFLQTGFSIHPTSFPPTLFQQALLFFLYSIPTKLGAFIHHYFLESGDIF